MKNKLIILSADAMVTEDLELFPLCLDIRNIWMEDAELTVWSRFIQRLLIPATQQ